jgi:phosphate uptake regulator/aminoglycoside phosphotransferase
VPIPHSIADNLRFLSQEVDGQLDALQALFTAPHGAAARRILDRSGYALNLKLRIQHDCLTRLAGGSLPDAEAAELRAIEFAANELDRIAELSRDCVRRVRRIGDTACLDQTACASMLDRVRQGITLIEPALIGRDTRIALKLGRIEEKLDADYDRLSSRYLAALKERVDTEDVLRALFVAHYIEQMGDALQDISETVLSSHLGQPLSLDRYRALQASLETLAPSATAGTARIEAVAETRSGSAVSRLATTDPNGDAVPVIFKEGVKRKLKEERQGVESWHAVYPGLAPRILAFRKQGRSASLLIEHLPGMTFEQLLLHDSPALLHKALKRLGKTLRAIWRETRTDTPASGDYIGQLRSRLDAVYRIHPEFARGPLAVCGRKIDSFDDLASRAAERERTLRAPFSVYIHGDFNIDNVLYDDGDRRISFIDLHRSRYMDYVQDISVFMVSNYRLQVLDAKTRERILQVVSGIHDIARAFAKRSGDTTFEIRLALGLARSFATSTRFILDKSLATGMFLRARYLIEKVLATPPDQSEAFRVPVTELFRD